MAGGFTCEFGTCDVHNDSDRKSDEAQAALSDPKRGFSRARKLVRQARSLLGGSVLGNEAEMTMPEPAEPARRA